MTDNLHQVIPAGLLSELGTVAARLELEGSEGYAASVREAGSILAALAAAPQPAPADREALAKIVQDAMIRTGVRWDSGSSEAIADALLARGLRRPGGETMAWAVVGNDDTPRPGLIYGSRSSAKVNAGPLGHIKRVAIRVVGGGDDA